MKLVVGQLEGHA